MGRGTAPDDRLQQPRFPARYAHPLPQGDSYRVATVSKTRTQGGGERPFLWNLDVTGARCEVAPASLCHPLGPA